uniref:t-SNARE coiled-coil homology domain-containing protein n=1 Tax=Romanomermis culicivorax TaxID=13658 RepID=A0A915I3R8_ROMCU
MADPSTEQLQGLDLKLDDTRQRVDETTEETKASNYHLNSNVDVRHVVVQFFIMGKLSLLGGRFFVLGGKKRSVNIIIHYCYYFSFYIALVLEPGAERCQRKFDDLLG